MEYCCDQYESDIKEYGRWMGGSHYHCFKCGGLTSMMGHYSAYCKKTKSVREAHRCCPDGYCELDKPE